MCQQLGDPHVFATSSHADTYCPYLARFIVAWAGVQPGTATRQDDNVESDMEEEEEEPPWSDDDIEEEEQEDDPFGERSAPAKYVLHVLRKLKCGRRAWSRLAVL